MISNIISFAFFTTERVPERGEENGCFQTSSSFLPVIRVPEYAEGGFVGRTIITNGNKYPNSLQIGQNLLILFKKLKLWSSKGDATKIIWFWLAFFSQNYAIKTKSDHR